MPTLNQNVLINGKVIRKGKNISAANVKKLELGDHLFDAEAKAPTKTEESPEAGNESSSDQD